METLRFLMVSTHFPPHHLGGDAQFVEYLSKELIDRGHEVHVFYNPAAYRLLRGGATSDKTLPQDGINRHLYSSRMGRMEPLLALSLGLWRKASQELVELKNALKPDVLHWHNPRGFIGKPFPLEDSICLYTNHDYTPVCPRSNLLKPGMVLCDDPRLCSICCMRWHKPPQLWRAGRRRVLGFPEDLHLLSPSEFMARRLEREGVSVHALLRGFVPDVGKNLPPSREIGESIVYLGLMEPHKGVQTLLEAFIRSKDGHDFKLYMIGEGSLRHHLEERVQRLGLADRINVTGFLPRAEVERIRNNAAVQVVPSVWYENAPSVVLEAYSLGIPVLASDIGGLPEIVGPDAGSALFPPGNTEALARLISGIWEKRDDFGASKRKARRAYEERYTPDLHVREYLRIVSDLR